MTVQRPDAQIRVLDTGGQGPVVVFLQGLAGNAQELLPLAAALGPGYRCVPVDQRGHGHSTRIPAGTSRAAFVDDGGDRCGGPGAGRGAGGPVDGRPHRCAHRRCAPGPDSRAGPARGRRLRPRFDPAVVQATIEAVHVPRWEEWQAVTASTTMLTWTPPSSGRPRYARPWRACPGISMSRRSVHQNSTGQCEMITATSRSRATSTTGSLVRREGTQRWCLTPSLMHREHRTSRPGPGQCSAGPAGSTVVPSEPPRGRKHTTRS